MQGDPESVLTSLLGSVDALVERMHSMQSVAGAAADMPLLATSAQIVVSELLEEAQSAHSEMAGQSERALDALSQFQQEIKIHETDVVQAVESLLQGFDQALDELQSEVEASVEVLAVAVADINGAMSSYVEDLSASATSLIEDGFKQAFGGDIGSADSELHDQLDAAVQRITAVVQHLVDLLLESLTNVEESLSDAISGSRSERAGTEPALDSLKPLVEPLLAQVERVQALARSVGI